MKLRRSTLGLPLLLLGVAAGCGDPPSSKECTLIGCRDGVDIEFSFQQEGTYVFDVMVDDVAATCEVTLPLEPSSSLPCDRDDVILSVVGSALPPEDQSIGGLQILSTTAKTITARAARDGVLLGEKRIPVEYTVSPGPNGPDCEPKECRSARATFP